MHADVDGRRCPQVSITNGDASLAELLASKLEKDPAQCFPTGMWPGVVLVGGEALQASAGHVAGRAAQGMGAVCCPCQQLPGSCIRWQPDAWGDWGRLLGCCCCRSTPRMPAAPSPINGTPSSPGATAASCATAAGSGEMCCARTAPAWWWMAACALSHPLPATGAAAH
jgi:hypothetical protein